jgi:predicted N-acetyltransferase YhbS
VPYITKRLASCAVYYKAFGFTTESEHVPYITKRLASCALYYKAFGFTTDEGVMIPQASVPFYPAYNHGEVATLLLNFCHFIFGD